MSDKPIVLIVDDEPDFAEFIGEVVEGTGFNCKLAGNGQELKDFYSQAKPVLIFLDIVMPDVDGVEALQWLAEQNCKAPIVLLSGHDPLYLKMADMVGSGNSLNIIANLRKPVRVDQIEKLLNDLTL